MSSGYGYVHDDDVRHSSVIVPAIDVHVWYNDQVGSWRFQIISPPVRYFLRRTSFGTLARQP